MTNQVPATPDELKPRVKEGVYRIGGPVILGVQYWAFYSANGYCWDSSDKDDWDRAKFKGAP